MTSVESKPSRTERSPDNRREAVEQVAEAFLEQIRRGERPSVEAYVQRHPELASEIRDLFPTLALLEECAPSDGAAPLGAVPEGSMASARMLGEYRIIREIGRGGMGVVYEAEHQTLQRRVALKLLPQQLASDASGLRRFVLEARAAGQLHHSNIVPVFEVGVHEGQHFYTMQYIHGQNLDSVIAELRRLPSAEFATDSLQLASDVAPVHSPEALSHTVAVDLLTGRFQGPQSLSASLQPETDGTSRPVLLPQQGASQHANLSADSAASAAPDSARIQPQEALQTKGRPGASERVGESSEFSRVGDAHETYFQRVGRVGLQVAEALDYAHRHGVLHRDIKPSNLILDMSGTVWVTDFGLAKHEGSDFTQSGDIVGTLRYMAPERLQGQADARSDLYGLGLTLYELSTLRCAVEGNDRFALIRQVEVETPPAPRQLAHGMPRDLETIILKLIEKSPAARYRSASDLAEDLRLFLADRPIRARRSTWTERGWRWCRRNPVPALLTSCVALLLILLLAGSLVFGLFSLGQARLLTEQKASAVQAQREAEQAREEAVRRLYDSCLGQARAGRWSARVGQHFETMDSLQQAAEILPSLQLAGTEEAQRRLVLRNEAIAAMPLIDLREIQTWPVPQGFTAMVALPPDYSIYARSDREGNILVRRLADDQEVARLAGSGQQAWFLTFSPDGRFLAGKFHGGAPNPTRPVARVWDLSNQQLIIEETKQLSLGRLAFRGDSRQLVLGMDSHEVRVYDLPEGTLTARHRVRNDPTDMAYSPDGRQLAISFPGVGPIEIWNCETDQRHPLQVAPDINALAWSPDGKVLAMGAYTGEIYLKRVDRTDQPARELVGHLQQVRQLQFNYRGDLLLSRAWDSTLRIWHVASGTQALRHDAAPFTGTGFRRDDRQLALLSDRTRFGIWEVAGGGPLRVVSSGSESGKRSCVQFHPRRSDLLASATDQGVELWDTVEGRCFKTLRADRSPSVCFAQDGQMLLASGASGIQRWPIADVGGPLDQLQVGTAETVRLSKAERVYIASECDVLAVDLGFQHFSLLDLASPEAPLPEFRHDHVDHAVISPNARWVVTTTWHGRGVCIWDTQDRGEGAGPRDLAPQITSATPAFSLDGRWLAVSDGYAYYLWEVGTWRQVYRIEREHADGWPGPVAFSPDNRLLAVAHTRYIAQLIDPLSGRTLGILETPTSESLAGFSFSHDSRYLAIAKAANIQLWDLATVHQCLQQMQIAWNLD